jgi:hypothetical protein
MMSLNGHGRTKSLVTKRLRLTNLFMARQHATRGAAILTFVKDKAFGPDDIEIMDAAFQLVCRLLKLSNRHGDARSTAAVMIIELMARGQRNPSTLAYAAIRELEHGSTGRH